MHSCMSHCPRLVPLSLLLLGACNDDAVAVTVGDSGSSGPSSSSTPPGATSSTLPPEGTRGSTGVGEGPNTGDSTGAGASTTGAVDPPIFDLGAVPDAPLNNPFTEDVVALLFGDATFIVGYGSEYELSGLLDVVEQQPLPELCGPKPEFLIIPAEAEFIYVVAYADDVGTQGLVGSLSRGDFYHGDPPGLMPTTVYTGDTSWDVCATGLDHEPGEPAPTALSVEEQITLCNDGVTDPETTSAGWVNFVGHEYGALAIGEPNNTPLGMGPQPGNEFPLVCADWLGDHQARWMWFNWDPAGIDWPMQSPFMHPGGEGNPMHELLIFRLPREAVPTW